MKRDFAFGLCVLIALAVILCVTAIASEKTDENSAPIFLTEIPQGYRDFGLIAVSRLTRGDGSSQLRAELGNDIAIKAYREGKLPFPERAMVAALHWNELSSPDNDKVLAKGFPGAGWGFGDFTNGKPGDMKLMKTCFGCHVPGKDHDFVFTHYAP